MKEEIDKFYTDGRVTIMTDEELESLIEKLAPGKFKI